VFFSHKNQPAVFLASQISPSEQAYLVLRGLKTFLSLTENIENSINICNSK
jgi:hypothetical protein